MGLPFEKESTTKERGARFASFLAVLFAFVSIPSALFSQTFTERIQKSRSGEGTIVIHQDSSIDELVNGGGEAAKPAKPAQPKKNNSPQPAKPTPQKPQEERTEVAADTIAVGQRRTHKANGYRIQVFAGNDSRRDQQRAMQQKNTLRAMFPGYQVYVTYKPPRWLCRVGDFATYSEAQEALSEVRGAGYPAATIVRDRVNLPN